MDRTPLDQILFEISYQILSREIEIEIFDQKVNDLRSSIAITKDKKDKADLEGAMTMAKNTVKAMREEIAYFQKKKEIAEWPRFKA